MTASETAKMMLSDRGKTNSVYISWSSCLVSKSCLTFLRPYELKPTRLLCPWDFPGKNIGMGCHFLFQGIFLTQGSNLLLRWQADSFPLSHQRSLIIKLPRSKINPRPRSGGCTGTGGPREAIPRWRSGRSVVRRYLSSKVRSSGCTLLEQPWRDTSRPR